MSDGDTIKVRRSDKAVCRLIDGDVVVLIPEEAILYALGGCGARVWELIDGKNTVSEIVSVICDEYEVEPEMAHKDVSEFINDLCGLKLVEVVTGIGEEIGH